MTGARGNFKTYAATTEAKASVRLIVPVLDAHTSGWREALFTSREIGVCSVLEGDFRVQPPLQCGVLPQLEALLAT